ncbi:NAD/NADP transhydrogenase beta subunit, partial [Pedobacter sp. UYEF25]
VVRYTLVANTNVATCFRQHLSSLRGFIIGSLSFNSSTLTYSYLCSRFSLSLSTITFQQSHHKVVW